MQTSLLKIYHAFSGNDSTFRDFLDSLSHTLKKSRLIFGIGSVKGELFYSLSTGAKEYPLFESHFYSHFPKFQTVSDDKGVWDFDPARTVVGEIGLENNGFFPFKMEGHTTPFVYHLFRTLENFDVSSDRVGFFIDITPIVGESFFFYVRSRLQFFFFRMRLVLKFFKYMFNFKTQKDWKKEGRDFYHKKLNEELFETRVFIVVQSRDRDTAEGKVKALFHQFGVFKNYPLNQFTLRVRPGTDDLMAPVGRSYTLSSREIATFFHFPREAKSETSLLKVKSVKLAVPIGTLTTEGKKLPSGDIQPVFSEPDINILGISDYRSMTVPIGIYDEDRLRHIYVIGKTGVGKSKFLVNLIRNDIAMGKGIGIIDPHGDLAEEVMMSLTPERVNDVIIFDPTDEKYPFCFNPLHIEGNESKQVLAKGFIDIFKKYFGVNWNPKLEHVLRMIFLALLDRPGSTLFDIIRALTDKDFRYEMITHIEDDVVKNFWTNEFAGWSQQFNTEAIMPILNKIGQLLSINMLRNIFASSENKINFREVMDQGKILIVKLSKGKLQEEIMGFLGAMFVTKIYQTAMSRQSVSKSERKPYFLYIDEFQNFATETFNEILSEARKYGLGLIVAHQFIKQIPPSISDSLFGNV